MGNGRAVTNLILNANISAIIYMTAVMGGTPGLSGSVLEIASAACASSLIYELIAKQRRERAKAEDALAFAAAALVLNVGSAMAGAETAATTLNIVVIACSAHAWLKGPGNKETP